MSTNDTERQETYVCSDCEKTFSTERGRDSHIEQVHGREYHSESLLRELYINRGMSSLEIAEKYDVSDSTIRNNLRRFDIAVRSTAESLIQKTPEQLKDENTLRRLYKREGYTDREIADMVGVGQPAVTNWRRRHGIEPDAPPSGEDHYAWNPESDQIEYGDNWDEMRKRTLNRDNHTCQACGDRGKDTLLDVHHIRKIRTFEKPELANTLDNLVVLCRPCHRKWEGIPLRPQ